MKRLEQVAAETAKKITELNVNQSASFFFFCQPKITKQLKKRLKKTKERT